LAMLRSTSEKQVPQFRLAAGRLEATRNDVHFTLATETTRRSNYRAAEAA
jgi:hypothetical protein